MALAALTPVSNTLSSKSSWCLTHIPHAAVQTKTFPVGWLLRVFSRTGWGWRLCENSMGPTKWDELSVGVIAARSPSLTGSILEEL